MEQIAYELHRPARRVFPRRHYKLEGIGDTWQMDLIDFNNLSRENANYSYILVVIDIFTKFVWTRPVKNKNAVVVRDAMQSVIESSPYGAPRNLHSDEGKEFINVVCKSLYAKYDINFYQTYTAMKASIVDRMRTRTDREERSLLNGPFTVTFRCVDARATLLRSGDTSIANGMARRAASATTILTNTNKNTR